MTAIITTCRRCRKEFAPDRATILAGTWRVCPACARTPALEPETRCQECGRTLRGVQRDLCLQCAGLSVL